VYVLYSLGSSRTVLLVKESCSFYGLLLWFYKQIILGYLYAHQFKRLQYYQGTSTTLSVYVEKSLRGCWGELDDIMDMYTDIYSNWLKRENVRSITGVWYKIYQPKP